MPFSYSKGSAARSLLGAGPFEPLRPSEPLRLASLTFNITNRCNLACPWCYNESAAGQEISTDELVDWLRGGAGLLDPEAAFFILGGEPMLNLPRLVQCVQGVRSCLRGEILVSTNGTWDPGSIVQQLVDVRVTVQVSLDGAHADSHDLVRGPGVFSQALDTVRHAGGTRRAHGLLHGAAPASGGRTGGLF